MAQRDKVKELVGRGLDSYHTKSLQQIDRIEKKNKEQNHKISILSNELDNDYLTKTEEGSVVSLEHSKEGMVYLDELQGNTLVNYCTDGSKELTLNGDIDVEGTFVTTTEGVDNGKIDVMCEGNTLVNILNKSLKFGLSSTSYLTCDENGVYNGILDGGNYFARNTDNTYWRELQPNTTYTLKGFLETTCNTTGGRIVFFTQDTSNVTKILTEFRVNELNQRIKLNLTFTTPSDCIGSFGFYVNPVANFDNVKFSFILEYGDTTSYEIPLYFEGMKSVGECEDNKIEILSQTLNLVDDFSKYVKGSNQVTFTKINNHSFSVEGDGSYKWQQVNFNIPFIQNAKAGDTFTLFAEEITLLNQDTSSDIGIQMRNTTLNMSISNSWQVNANKPIRNGLIKFTIPNNYNGTDILDLRVHVNHNVALANKVTIKNLMIAKGHVDISSFKPYGLNKKEISLNEPLRKSNDNVKDRFVKIGNKYYIERNCQQLTINGNEPNVTWRSDGVLNNNVYRFWSNNFPNCITLNQEGCIYTGDYEKVYQANAINVHVSTSKITEDSVELFVEYLKQNPLTVVIKRATPIYEPIEDAELITYLDTTHISNNSIIPCTMKVKNSGYNAIIKPSTLYTIALDTNKSGTIGMNLGGAKGTTTNNVTTITTPATLTNDSLRLYGKGIKGSKIRLLEGDKTNWIPSHFEGMKSSFEDKLQDDGTYKMEILSNNKNLFNESILENVNSNYYEIINKDNRRCLKIEKPSLMHRTGILNQLKKNTSYKISFDMLYDRIQGNGLAQGAIIYIAYTDGTSHSCYAGGSYNEWLNATVKTPSNKTISYIQFSYGTNTPTYIDLDTFIIQENSNLVDYIYPKTNKIQFSSIEPLRGVGSAKDKFVFKDNKLMIERNVKQFILSDVSTISFGTKNTKMAWIKNLDTFYPNDNVFSSKDVYNNKIIWNNIHSLIVSYDEYVGFGAKCVDTTATKVEFSLNIPKHLIGDNRETINEWLQKEPLIVQIIKQPTYEEIPFELQKIILEGYENGTIFFDTNIPPTSTITYAGETPIVKATKLNKTEVLNNTNDINDNIIPYLMDMDYRVVCLQLQSENINDGVSMARLFGGAYEMLQRDIQSKRYSIDEYRYRLDAYLGANKITEEEYNKLGDMLND